ncbi:ribulose-phosphate 3-epimerase [Entomobacter blattae]|uniref:Ribulose-phosphate 3-epimerase n=1 Tax=Entomobacter blattae TaxID=2762277 RepID=A0A7H1NQR1_9PROT|nr:ribulose-phosphate 3-epimerase [Entomobacter blattae]QNT78121.1 Ribulose-phosphate 3-epimerase [Entomobacter blattae]
MPKLTPPLVAPSLLSADFSRAGEEAAAVEKAGADWLHLDVMDGHFVPNITFGPLMLQALRPHVKIPFDVHLMIQPVDLFLEPFVKAGANHLLVHIESGPHVYRTLQHIQALGAKPGIVLCPATPPEAISEVMGIVDIILVMTVNPGFGGQQFLPSQLEKIRKIREMIEKTGRDIRLMVDGGINHETAPLAVAAGADVIVAGTAVYGQKDYAEAIKRLKSFS